ncbi:MAG: hypothetical protein A2092_00650 [Rhodobacteraceae bacterium GWE1_64_9]|nr:MAG: hypothetical protein A2092_00650 [Rhodobacteraceae bacterium GWE1_64_9]OHC47241.1 MAG: hypothetical protein A2X69_18350 [Rhodobacteraceae bacterium GWF1_65_7]HBD90765.1 hypothetical protein [Gemmobacter sp.]HBU15549.1 hypothetical protein [Gemmobacter sp.]
MRDYWRAGVSVLAWAAGGLSAGLALADTPATIIVMDGSGSMWGQIDGRPKLEIARETVAGVLDTIPEGQALGLLAYGHREKGNCGDIELMVPPAPGTAAQIRDAVNAMRFLGKTPLSDAVRQAAEALRFGEEAATVVLVTDGLETCAADPCALGQELEAAGLDFTAHVIGFGLSAEEGAQVACLAENTGGRYFQAGDATALAEALQATVVAAEPQPPQPPQEPLPEATLEAPATAPMGQPVAVGWTGPAAELDTIEIGLPGNGERWGWEYVKTGNPVSLLMPGTPGIYELRYKFRDQTVIATREIEVTEAPVTMTVSEQVLAGREFSIRWTGPNAPYDNIQIAEAGSDSYLSYAYVSGGNPLVMTAPDAPGAYELRYKLSDTEVIATEPLTVLPEDAVLPDVAPGPLPVVIEADAGGVAFNVVWSAVPVEGQGLPPEAWAMPEGVAGPVSADFLPGLYDVTGMAGDQVFAGRIAVAAGAENRFVIPLSPALSPAGEDAGGASDMPAAETTALGTTGQAGPVPLPVPLRIKGVYDGVFATWEAFPLGGQESPLLASGAARPGAWETQLDPGPWLIRGRHEGARGATYLAVLQVAAGMAPEVTMARPRYGATPGDGTPFAWMCDGDLPCFVHDKETGLQLGLPAGWGMEDPVLLTTAAGVSGSAVFATFMPLRADRGTALVAVNPRQWDAMLGPCAAIRIGQVCRDAGLTGEDLQAYRMIEATLEYGVSEEAPAGSAVAEGGGGLADRIKGTRLQMPEGVNLLEILAPQFAPKE